MNVLRVQSTKKTPLAHSAKLYYYIFKKKYLEVSQLFTVKGKLLIDALTHELVSSAQAIPTPNKISLHNV